MSAIKNLIGNRYGRLTVLERAENSKHNKAMWLCRCDCGKTKVICGSKMIKGETKSCGCYMIDKAIETGRNNKKHGQRNSQIYNIWHGMKLRCFNKNDANYKSYGARGITMCEEWRNDFTSFYEWALTNGYKEEYLDSGKSKLTIDRIDNNGNYEPSNCRWVSYKEQARNRRGNKLITYNGETLPLVSWCEKFGIPYSRTRNRVSKGMSFDLAVKNVDYRKNAQPL